MSRRGRLRAHRRARRTGAIADGVAAMTSLSWAAAGLDVGGLDLDGPSRARRRDTRSVSQAAAAWPSAAGRAAGDDRAATLALQGLDGLDDRRRLEHEQVRPATAPPRRSPPSWCCTPDGRAARRRVTLALRAVVMLSTLGPRGSLTDICGSTGSSHSQQRQPSRSPTSSTRLTGRRWRRGRSPAARAVEGVGRHPQVLVGRVLLLRCGAGRRSRRRRSSPSGSPGPPRWRRAARRSAARSRGPPPRAPTRGRRRAASGGTASAGCGRCAPTRWCSPPPRRRPSAAS